MFFYNLPKTARIRVGRHALKHQCGGPVCQRAVQDVTVACYPAHISSTPVNILILTIKHIMMSHRGINHIAACGMQNPFWFPCGAGCIKNEHRVFSIHFGRRTSCISSLYRLVIPDIPSVLPGDISTSPAHDKTGCAIRACYESLISIGFQWDRPSPSYSFIRGNYNC